MTSLSTIYRWGSYPDVAKTAFALIDLFYWALFSWAVHTGVSDGNCNWLTPLGASVSTSSDLLYPFT